MDLASDGPIKSGAGAAGRGTRQEHDQIKVFLLVRSAHAPGLSCSCLLLLLLCFYHSMVPSFDVSISATCGTSPKRKPLMLSNRKF